MLKITKIRKGGRSIEKAGAILVYNFNYKNKYMEVKRNGSEK